MSDPKEEFERTVGSLKGNPKEVSKDEIWREMLKRVIDLA